MNTLAGYIAYARKAIINVVGLLGAILTLDLLPDPYAGWVSGAIAVLTALVHFATPNADDPDPAGGYELGDEPAVDDDTTGAAISDEVDDEPAHQPEHAAVEGA